MTDAAKRSAVAVAEIAEPSVDDDDDAGRTTRTLRDLVCELVVVDDAVVLVTETLASAVVAQGDGDTRIRLVRDAARRLTDVAVQAAAVARDLHLMLTRIAAPTAAATAKAPRR